MEKQFAGIAEKGAIAAEGERIAEAHPEDGDKTAGGKTLHDSCQHIFLAHKPAVKQGKARNCHHEYETGCGQHPGRISRIHRAFGSEGLACLKATQESHQSG